MLWCGGGQARMIDRCDWMKLKEGQIWRKRGPCGWLKILQILDPKYECYDGGLPGARVLYYPAQDGIQRPCRDGSEFFVANVIFEGTLVTWEEQIVHNRYLLK